MAEITFIYNQNPTIIQCKENDLLRDVFEKYSFKIGIKSSNLYFLSKGQRLDPNHKVKDIFKSELMTKSKIQILAYSNTEENQVQNVKISNEVICPRCKEACQINVKDYKMAFSGCKNGHTIKNILISDYKNNETIDESKIICNSCNNNNKASTFNNQFYICISCKQNLCPVCKSKHNKGHDTIDYEQKNYICFNHNEKFTSFCKNCKINLCIECEAKHKDKQNLIYYRDILPDKDKYKTNLNELKKSIDKYKEKINEIKNMFDKIIIDLETYYEINNNLLNDYEKKKKNYELLRNINELEKFNISVINDVNLIIKNEGFFEIISNSINLINKMDIKYNGKSIQPISGKEMIGIKGKIVDNFLNEDKDSKNIKELYENFIKKNNESPGATYDKLIYAAMLAEQCSLYEDMNYFIKGFIKQKSESINSDERNLFSISCKNIISKYRSAIRTIQAYESKEKKKQNSTFLPYIKEYKKIVENVFNEKCLGIIKFIDENIIKTDNFRKYDDEGKIFFYKMIGDQYRFICETDSFKSDNNINQVNKYFNEGLKLANNLPIYNPVKLGLILNTSVFYYEIIFDKKKAIELAKSTVEKFKKESTKLDEGDDDVKDAISIINLMEENYEMWKSE